MTLAIPDAAGQDGDRAEAEEQGRSRALHGDAGGEGVGGPADLHLVGVVRPGSAAEQGCGLGGVIGHCAHVDAAGMAVLAELTGEWEADENRGVDLGCERESAKDPDYGQPAPGDRIRVAQPYSGGLV
jgi:hypothetical protein